MDTEKEKVSDLLTEINPSLMTEFDAIKNMH